MAFFCHFWSTAVSLLNKVLIAINKTYITLCNCTHSDPSSIPVSRSFLDPASFLPVLSCNLSTENTP